MDFIQKLLDASAADFPQVWRECRPEMTMVDSLNAEKVLHYLTFPLPPVKALQELFCLTFNAEYPLQALGMLKRAYRADFHGDKRLSPLFTKCLTWRKEATLKLGVGEVYTQGRLLEFEGTFLSSRQRDLSYQNLLSDISMLGGFAGELFGEIGEGFDAKLALSIAKDRNDIENLFEGVEMFQSQRAMRSLVRELQILDKQLQRWDWSKFGDTPFEATDLRAVVANDAVPLVPDKEPTFWQRVFFNRPAPMPMEEIEKLLTEDY